MDSVGQKLQAGPVGQFRRRRAQEVGVPGDWSWNGAEGRGGGVDGRQGPLGAAPTVCPPGITGLLRGTVASGHVASLATGPQTECSNKEVTTGIPFSDQDGESAQHHFHWILLVETNHRPAQIKREEETPPLPGRTRKEHMVFLSSSHFTAISFLTGVFTSVLNPLHNAQGSF